MDDHTFDAVARTLASGRSRRQTLRLLAAGALAPWLPRGAASALALQECEAGLTFCGGACIDVASHPHNCGECGVVCGSGVCEAGVCTPEDTTCAAGLTYCPFRSDGQPAGCYDLGSDYFHCGSCDRSCPSASPGPMACIGGECVVTGCAEGLTDCTGTLDCVDLVSDPFNCGGCGTVCDSGVCEAGSCVQVGCPVGSWDCDGNGICISLLDDPNHCGTCGTVCASGVCEGGFCTTLGCAPGLVACPYSVNLGPAGCYDLATDRNRCGSCDTYCWRVGSPVYHECIEGTCVETRCLEGLTDCSGNLDCVNLEYDANNCGTCGTVCPSGWCQAGVCVSEDMPCAPGFTYCPEGTGAINTAPGCWDLSSEPYQCGACGNVCASGVCNGGVCAEDTTCAADLAYCPSRQISIGAAGEPYELPAGCYDLSSDRDHCGSCENTCPTTVGCYAGECGLPPCDEGLTRCAAGCVDLEADPDNCGTCTTTCAADEVCEAGTCTTTTTRAITDDGTPTTTPTADETTREQEARRSRRGRETSTETQQGAQGAGGVTDATTETRATRTPRTRDRALEPGTADTAQSAAESVLTWPFDPEAGQWTIIHGYRAEDEDTTTAATPPADRGDFTHLALAFAVCSEEKVDVADGTCDLGEAGGDPSWDRQATQGSTVVSPVDGTVAWTEGEPSCLAVAIDVAGHPGYRVAVYNVEGDLERGQRLARGKRIGKVPRRGCEPGDRLRMELYRLQTGTSDDPVMARQSVPFDGEWAIAGCEYPDDKRTAEQYRGELVPCNPEDETPANS